MRERGGSRRAAATPRQGAGRGGTPVRGWKGGLGVVSGPAPVARLHRSPGLCLRWEDGVTLGAVGPCGGPVVWRRTGDERA